MRRQHRLGFKRGCSLIAALKANKRTVATGLSEVRNNLESVQSTLDSEHAFVTLSINGEAGMEERTNQLLWSGWPSQDTIWTRQ